MKAVSRISIGAVCVFVCGIVVGIYLVEDASHQSLLKSASAQQSKRELPKISPTKALADRDIYYPGTEDLKPHEMRITALGTGMPSARPKQAAACFLVELGNGDKFLFDIGSGSHERIAAQKIPYDYLDKVFIGHLHVDHFGDLPTFWLGGTRESAKKWNRKALLA